MLNISARHFIFDPLFRFLIGVVTRKRRSPHKDQDSCQYFSFMLFHLRSPVKTINTHLPFHQIFLFES